jgi:alpha-L-fucosidase
MNNGLSYPAQFLPTGAFVHEGIEFALPADWEQEEKDNVRVAGQRVFLPAPKEISAVHLLVAGEGAGGEFTRV